MSWLQSLQIIVKDTFDGIRYEVMITKWVLLLHLLNQWSHVTEADFLIFLFTSSKQE
jgi:hypothetical protein